MFWKRKPKCTKFFKYDSKELNISGLKASLPKGTETIDIGLGEVRIKPELTQVSEKIQNLDLLQFSLCHDVQQLSDDNSKQSILSKIIEAKLEMMKLAQNPELSEQELKKKS